jgi:hypothetical protein
VIRMIRETATRFGGKDPLYRRSLPLTRGAVVPEVATRGPPELNTEHVAKPIAVTHGLWVLALVRQDYGC